MRTTAFPGRTESQFSSGREYQQGLLGHEHRVDQVNSGVGRLDAAADHVGAISLECILAAGHGHRTALDRLMGADDLVGSDLARDNVVGEDLAQQGVILLEGFDRGGVYLGESVVNRCEDSELAVSVFRSGLFEAATATGSSAMPETEPAPLGTFSA